MQPAHCVIDGASNEDAITRVKTLKESVNGTFISAIGRCRRVRSMEEGFAPAVNAPPCGPDVHDLLTPPTITTSAMANRRDPRCLVCWHESQTARFATGVPSPAGLCECPKIPAVLACERLSLGSLRAVDRPVMPTPNSAWHCA
jgi:hypothetical protein